MVYTEWLAMISERGVVYRTKRMGPSTEPWGTPMSCDGDEDELLTEVDWYLFERYEWNHWSAVDRMPKTELRRERRRRIWWPIPRGVKSGRKSPTKEEQKCCHCQSRAERILFTIRNKTVPMLCQSCSIGWLKGIAEVVFWAGSAGDGPRTVCGEPSRLWFYHRSEPAVWPSGSSGVRLVSSKGPRFESALALLSFKNCGLCRTLSCGFVPQSQLMKH